MEGRHLLHVLKQSEASDNCVDGTSADSLAVMVAKTRVLLPYIENRPNV